MSCKVPQLLGCEKRKKTPTLSTNTLSYQQNRVLRPYLLAFKTNPYKFVTGLKIIFNNNLIYSHYEQNRIN